MPDVGLIHLLEHAAAEVQDLRKQRDKLAAQMEVVTVFRAALLGPPQPQGYGVDLVHLLRKKIAEMQACPHEENEIATSDAQAMRDGDQAFER